MGGRRQEDVKKTASRASAQVGEVAEEDVDKIVASMTSLTDEEKQEAVGGVATRKSLADKKALKKGNSRKDEDNAKEASDKDSKKEDKEEEKTEHGKDKGLLDEVEADKEDEADKKVSKKKAKTEEKDEED